MSGHYFSDREHGPVPREREEISRATWGGIVASVESHIQDGSFGYRYPLLCSDVEKRATIGCDRRTFFLALQAQVPGIDWPLQAEELPTTSSILDMLTFCHQKIAKPVENDLHSYFQHWHLKFDREAGQTDFLEEINQILARSGLTYELKPDSRVLRIGPPVLRETLVNSDFNTGDEYLDGKLETARNRFFDADIQVRRDALEKLWDAWERLKSDEHLKKDQSADLLVHNASFCSKKFYELLDKEARELSAIGNNFCIRHHEIIKEPINESAHIDYLFHRMFSIIHLFLRATNRGN